MKLPRRRFLHLAAGAAALPAISRVARAQAYPTRPVRICCWSATGTSPDIAARLIGQWLSERLGQQLIVKIGRAQPETWPSSSSSEHRRTAIPFCSLIRRRNTTRHCSTSLATISSATSRRSPPFSRFSYVMVVNPSFPAKTFPEFVAYAADNPGKLNYASPGIGTGPHVAGELLKMMAGVNIVHVPYRGGPAAITDLLAGQVQVFLRHHGAFTGVHQGRQAASIGGDDRDTLGGAARHPDRWRIFARLRGEFSIRPRRAQEHDR